MQEQVDRSRTLLATYAESAGDEHNPVYRVLSNAINVGAWGIVAAQCESMLNDFPTRRRMTETEEDALRQLGVIAHDLRMAFNQSLAMWSTSTGRWEMGYVALGAWDLSGWKIVS